MEAFVRIQKSGSTSLKESLKGSNNLIFLEHAYCYKIDNTNTGWVWDAQFPQFNKNNFSKLYALVRNPFEILVSYYHHNHPLPNGKNGWCNCNKVHNFNSWQEFLNSYINTEFKWHLPPMKKSMYSFAYDENGILIIDKFFKLENLETINQFLNERGLKELGKINITKNKPTDTKFYNPNQIKQLELIWENDLNYFGYEYNGI